MFSLIWAWVNGCANNQDTSDLRCHCAHYDVIAMSCLQFVYVLDGIVQSFTKCNRWNCWTVGNTLCMLGRLVEQVLTHWSRVMHICVSNHQAEWRIHASVTIIGSDNGLLPDRHQVITWTNAGILLIGPLGTNFREIWIKILIFSFKKCIWKCHLRNWGHFLLA